MSFIDSIIDVGSGVWNTLTGPSVAGGVARAAALGYMLKEVTASINKDNTKPSAAQDNNATTPDYGVREQIDPSTDNSIPVVYGTAFLQGSIVDAVLTNSNQTMFYAIAICERTGIKLSDGNQSQILFDELYWNGDKINFQGDGITVLSQTNSEGTTNLDMNGLVKFWLYNNGSENQVGKTGVQLTEGTASAYNIFPNWTVDHKMTELVFAIVQVDYNKSKNITGLGTLEFKMRNTMTQPGDVLNDYLTNARYGAGLGPEEIYSV
jgi:hypothetical protein